MIVIDELDPAGAALVLARDMLRARVQTNPKRDAPTKRQIKAFYNSWQWKRLRYAFLKDKQRRCECCGATAADGARIVVDHIKPVRRFWHLRLDRTNLQVACDCCNRGKGSHDQSDFRTAEQRA